MRTAEMKTPIYKWRVNHWGVLTMQAQTQHRLFSIFHFPFAVVSRRTLSLISAVAIATALWSGTTSAAPVFLNSIYDLQGVANNLSGDYILASNLDASVTSTWNSGAGFVPIGSASTPFTGTFDGRGFSITDLFLTSSAVNANVGLFGYSTGVVSNVTLSNAVITGSGQRQSVGAVVGYNSGQVQSVTVNGTVKASGEFSHAGGVVGTNAGNVVRSNANVNVTGNTTAVTFCCSDYGVGGVVGNNRGTVDLSFAAGSAKGGSYNGTGGLVGVNRGGGAITQSFSTSAVEGQATVANAGGGYVGGLVGLNRGGIVDRAYATGTVASPGYAGGLVGLADVGGSISQSYASGRVTAPVGASGTIASIGYGGVSTSILYWDTQSTGQSTSAAGTGLTTAQFQSGALPAGFDPQSWTAVAGRYPYLSNNLFSVSVNNLSTPPSFVDLSMFAGAAYRNSSQALPAGYSLGFSLSMNNVDVSYWVNASKDQVVIGIGGSQQAGDFFLADTTFLNPFGNPTQNFIDHIDATAAILALARQKYPNATIQLTGHSLGGAAAQVVAEAAGLRAVTFNAPGAQQTFNDSAIQLSIAGITKSGSSNIVNLRVYGDLVSTVGTQFGREITFEPPILKDIVDKYPVGVFKTLHKLDIVLERILSGAPVTSSIGPTAAEAITINPLNPIKTVASVFKGAVNIPVLIGALFFIDPSDFDGYLFQVADGSPKVRSILFPFLFKSEAAFDLQLLNGDQWSSLGIFRELDEYDFGLAGVDSFRFFIKDYNTLNVLTGVEEFSYGLTFVESGQLAATLTSFSSVPEPGVLSMVLLGIASIAMLRPRRLANPTLARSG